MSDQATEIGRDILDSEDFMWLMVGANHPEAHISSLRDAYMAYCSAGGGFYKAGERRLESARALEAINPAVYKARLKSNIYAAWGWSEDE
jgi:hypothetical protein